ncbi:MAG: hypothetical protein KC800_23250 [Candidatus Eremiobacteraeota bacterium]|nr:hypothetical protein [Candidatus Eremiobacteraeota bacterium]
MISARNHVQPRSSTTPHNRIDFSKIDTAEEAMLSPGGDLWVGLLLGPLNGHVTVTTDDSQVLTYETQLENGKLNYTGSLNGRSFHLEGKGVAPQGIRVQGETPGGVIDSLRRGGGMGFGLDGNAGSVEFSQILALDRSGGTNGYLAFMGGTIADQELEARVFKGDDGAVEVRGYLGDTPIFQDVRKGEEDRWIIRGNIGSQKYTQVIERR